MTVSSKAWQAGIYAAGTGGRIQWPEKTSSGFMRLFLLECFPLIHRPQPPLTLCLCGQGGKWVCWIMIGS